jgi:hypothetical protein
VDIYFFFVPFFMRFAPGLAYAGTGTDFMLLDDV